MITKENSFIGLFIILFTVTVMCCFQTARPKSQPPPSSRPRPAVHSVIRGDEVDTCHSPGGGTGSPSAVYSTVSKKSPHKHFHITSYVTLVVCQLKHFLYAPKVCEYCIAASSFRSLFYCMFLVVLHYCTFSMLVHYKNYVS